MMRSSEITLALKQRRVTLPVPCVMGIINCSSASFYQALTTVSDALKKADEMVRAGATLIDVGAVATNPSINLNSDIPSVEAECERVIAVVEAIAKNFDVLISVDTCQPFVMEAAAAAGAHIINDQRALHEPNALETMVKLQTPVCLMHHFDPIRKPDSCSEHDLIAQIKKDLQRDVQRCLSAGITRDRIIIDPGFGGGHFGKSLRENFYLLSQLDQFKEFELPILVGLSRKSFFGELLNLPVEARLNASLAGAVIAAIAGAAIIRVHDVKETVEAMAVVRQIYYQRNRSDSDCVSRNHCI